MIKYIIDNNDKILFTVIILKYMFSMNLMYKYVDLNGDIYLDILFSV